MESQKIRLIIADDHDLVREGIHARLITEANIDLVAEAKNGQEAVELCSLHEPDLLLLDISMPELNGLEAAKIIRQNMPDIKILFLSVYDNEEYVREALRIGANGFVLKDASKNEMLNAISIATNGATYLGPKLSRSIAASLGKSFGENESTHAKIDVKSGEHTCASDYGLTNREKEVLAAISNGMPNKQIAEDMNISVRTVESHRMSIREKTGGGNAVMLTKIAIELGL